MERCCHISLLLSSILFRLDSTAFISFVEQEVWHKWKKIKSITSQSTCNFKNLDWCARMKNNGIRRSRWVWFSHFRKMKSKRGSVFCVKVSCRKSCFFWTWMNSWKVSDISSRDVIWGTLGRAMLFSLSAFFFRYSLPASSWLALLLSYWAYWLWHWHWVSTSIARRSHGSALLTSLSVNVSAL